MIPSLHIVTDDEILRRPEFARRGLEVLETGGEEIALHLRGPRTPGRVLFSLGRELAAASRTFGALLLANDRVDLALALDLPGAHLGQRSIPPAAARKLLGPDRILGLSVHGLGEAREGGSRDVDFFLVGTIFPSRSHPSEPTGGVGRISEIRTGIGIPLMAIGGISPGRVEPVMNAGGSGVAVKGGIWDARDPVAAVEEYLSELRKQRGK